MASSPALTRCRTVACVLAMEHLTHLRGLASQCSHVRHRTPVYPAAESLARLGRPLLLTDVPLLGVPSGPLEHHVSPIGKSNWPLSELMADCDTLDELAERHIGVNNVMVLTTASYWDKQLSEAFAHYLVACVGMIELVTLEWIIYDPSCDAYTFTELDFGDQGMYMRRGVTLRSPIKVFEAFEVLDDRCGNSIVLCHDLTHEPYLAYAKESKVALWSATSTITCGIEPTDSRLASKVAASILKFWYHPGMINYRSLVNGPRRVRNGPPGLRIECAINFYNRYLRTSSCGSGICWDCRKLVGVCDLIKASSVRSPSVLSRPVACEPPLVSLDDLQLHPSLLSVLV